MMNFIAPVLESSDVLRDVEWFEKKLGFKYAFGDKMYAGVRRERQEIHIQWHAGTPDDPVNGGAVIKIFVDKIQPYYEELLERGAIMEKNLRMNTPWGTHEIGLYDLNRNAIYFVMDK